MQTRSGRSISSDTSGNFQECTSESFNPVFPQEKICMNETYNNSQCCNYSMIIVKFTIIVCLLSIIHWVLVTMYISWCYNPGIWGAITNIFTVGSPICLALNRIQSLISDHFIGLFISSVVGFNTALHTLFRF